MHLNEEMAMQDPTGICKANVHYKVMQDNEIGPQTQIGSILILKKVFLDNMSFSLCTCFFI